MHKESQETISPIHRISSSVERVAVRTDLSKSYIRNEIRAGNLRAVRRGRRVLILEEDLQEYLRGVRVEPD
jgi:excisionase family DNA binding protein